MKYFISIIILACCSTAFAQDLRPRIVFIFDTSGSMGVDVATGAPTGGDNSEAHPGDGNLSRLFVAKSAVSALIETTSEVQFALMRYPQAEGAGLNRGRIDGFQLNTYDGLEQTPLNYAGGCMGQLADPAPDRASSLLVPLADDNELDILQWMDGQEDWPNDRELRADGPTPIAASLSLAQQYLRDVVVADPVADCRQYAVVLLTDGGESCVPAADRAAELTARADRLQMLGVRTYVVAFGVGQNDLNALAALARAGGTAINQNGRVDLRRGLPYQADDLQGLRAAFSRILEDAIPVETCNDLDDDCDGRIDEGVLNACGLCGEAPVEACDGVDQDCDGRIDEGALNACGGCGAVPEETCNEVDDDCDGQVDEAVVNACGGCAGVSEEVCNNIDDDCDGRIDNVGDAALSRACGSDIGACTVGAERCEAGVWLACDGVAPQDEACNRVDDDCDGVVDEAGVDCGPAVDIGDVGECRVGVRRCDPDACDADAAACGEDGWLVECEGAVGPAEEICDGRDNDCDGMPDEGLFNACGRCGPTPPESCNGIDDNCDGRIDEDARCPTGLICFAGECTQRCDSSGECRGDLACQTVYPGGRFCHPNPCAGADCGPGRRCDPEQAACIDPCVDVECPEGEGCDLGECVPATCRHTGCPAGLLCRGDLCVDDDPCADVDCGEDGFCRGGDCVPVCRRQACGADQACVEGACVPDPCGGRCLRGQRCDPSDGACVQDACAGIDCPVGMACVDGACSVDAPCAAIECPAGTRCFDGYCTDFTPGVPPIAPNERPMFDRGVIEDAGVDMQVSDQAVDMQPAPPTPPATGDDDGGCSARPGPGGAGWLIALLCLGWRRRRLWMLAGLGLLGCDDGDDQIRLTADFQATDFQPFDRGRSDAGTGCRPSPEVCDTIDNDCDGLIDGDDPDLLTQLLVDPDNCGRCDAVCQAPNARFACQAGECIIVECAPGFGDYNANIADGCEADCIITAGGVEICDETDNDCDGRLDEGFDLQIDLENCGGCGVTCDPATDARVACTAGECTFECERGFVDLDGDPANGCEYACEARAGEICNGLDDDCDGEIDEAEGRAPPEIECGDEGVCASECGNDGDCEDGVCVNGVCAPAEVPELACERDTDCQAEHPGLACVTGMCVVRSRQPVCDGANGYRCVRPVNWRLGDEAGRCDGADNDCDGRVDEDVVGELFEADRTTPRPCFVGLGLCQREGLSECSADGTTVVCSARPGPPDDPDDDDCDGIDDDCDGVLDEGHLDAWIAIGAFEIYAYEASRPGATPFVAGRDIRDDDDALIFVEGRACSRPGVLPWAEVTWPQAQEACALAGGRLCTDAEWSLACGGAASAAYPYGARYDAQACNGGAYDIDPETDGVQDGLLHTGRLETCDRGGVLDLSGNLKEWTAQAQDGLRVVRGGSYESNVPAGLMCDQRNDLKAEAFRHPGIGFRCCR